MALLNETNINRRVLLDASPLVDRIHWAVVFVAMPFVAFLGVIGNSLSVVVLYRQGFKKSSNILLFTLAISDILFVIGANGPTKNIYEWGRGGFWYPEKYARIFYYLYHIFDYMNWCAGPMSMAIPMLITAERFVAVFFPLRFNTIVTARRTLIALIVLAFITYTPQIYVRFWFRFEYVFDPTYNTSVGLAARTRVFFEQEYASMLIGEFYAATGYFVFVVSFGSLAIGIRISFAATQRRRMMSGGGIDKRRVGFSKGGEDGQQLQSKTRATSKTTKTLLTLNAFYIVSCLFVAMPTFFPTICVWPLFTLNPNFRSMEVFVYHLAQLDLCVNASINFFIYVVMNPNFRETFLEIFGRKKKPRV